LWSRGIKPSRCPVSPACPSAQPTPVSHQAWPGLQIDAGFRGGNLWINKEKRGNFGTLVRKMKDTSQIVKIFLDMIEGLNYSRANP
jgi:hypothetical protein